MILLVSASASAQLNVRIGYNLGIVSADAHDLIIRDFNAQQEVLFDRYEPMPNLRVAFGVGLGLRYKFRFGALTFDWENFSRERSSVGINRPGVSSTPVAVTQEFQTSMNMFLVGVETFYGKVGVGSAIGVNSLDMQINAIGDQDFSLLDNAASSTRQLFARFSLSFAFDGNQTVSFSLKPFIQIPLGSIDLSSAAQELAIFPQNGSTEDYMERFPLFGLSFNFYNGRQD